jgi:hypothetical protein
LQALDTYKQTPRGSSITYIDLQTGRVVIGFGSGTKATTDSSPNMSQQADAGSTPTPMDQIDNHTNQAARANTNSSRKPEGGKEKKPSPLSVGNALRPRRVTER